MPDAAGDVRPPSSVVLYLRTAIKSVSIIVNITTKWECPVALNLERKDLWIGLNGFAILAGS
jgi:hypothetical protein